MNSATVEALKGPAFADAVRRVCDVLPPVAPVEGLRHCRILAAGGVSGENMFATLGFIAHALRMRGAQVTFLQCDQLLPACVAKIVSHHESACTRWCHKHAASYVEAMRLHCRWHSEFITDSERAACDAIAAKLPADQIADFTWRDVQLGPLVELSVRRYFQRGDIDTTSPQHLPKTRDYLRSALYMCCVARRALETLQIDKVYMTDGTYVDWGVIRAVAGLLGIPVDYFDFGYRGHSLQFFSDPARARTTPMASWFRWCEVPLTQAEERTLDHYVRERYRRPYTTFQGPPSGDVSAADCRQDALMPRSRPQQMIFGIFTNIGLDAYMQMSGASHARPIDWIIETVEFFLQNPQHGLIIKTHPFETWNKRPSMDRVDQLLASRFGRLPKNIQLLPPESTVAAHDVIRHMDVGLVYASTVQIEIALFAKPCIAVGGGPHAGTGIARDVARGEDYSALLASVAEGRLRLPVDPTLARRYAYYMFMRRSIPFNCVDAFDWDVTRVKIDSLSDLAPGRDHAMDVICRGLLCDEPFECDPELC